MKVPAANAHSIAGQQWSARTLLLCYQQALAVQDSLPRTHVCHSHSQQYDSTSHRVVVGKGAHPPYDPHQMALLGTNIMTLALKPRYRPSTPSVLRSQGTAFRASSIAAGSQGCDARKGVAKQPKPQPTQRTSNVLQATAFASHNCAALRVVRRRLCPYLF